MRVYYVHMKLACLYSLPHFHSHQAVFTRCVGLRLHSPTSKNDITLIAECLVRTNPQSLLVGSTFMTETSSVGSALAQDIVATCITWSHMHQLPVTSKITSLGIFRKEWFHFLSNHYVMLTLSHSHSFVAW